MAGNATYLTFAMVGMGNNQVTSRSGAAIKRMAAQACFITYTGKQA
jgi:hypothetical protein